MNYAQIYDRVTGDPLPPAVTSILHDTVDAAIASAHALARPVCIAWTSDDCTRYLLVFGGSVWEIARTQQVAYVSRETGGIVSGAEDGQYARYESRSALPANEILAAFVASGKSESDGITLFAE